MAKPDLIRFRVCLAVRDPMQCSRMEITLTDDGYEVVTFRSARELWDSYARCRPRYIITDRRFPDGFSALDLCRHVRQDYLVPYVYIHVLSDLSRIEEIEEALDCGASDYSVKPLSRFQLRARVRVGFRWLQYLDSITVSRAPAGK